MKTKLLCAVFAAAVLCAPASAADQIKVPFTIGNNWAGTLNWDESGTAPQSYSASVVITDWSTRYGVGPYPVFLASSSVGVAGSPVSRSISFSYSGHSMASGFITFLGVSGISITNIRTARDGALVSHAPEPESWAMFIFGFGAVGTAMRTRKKALATA